MKKISILGSTGSIGKQTCDVVRQNPDKLQIVALAANNNWQLLQKQIEEFHPAIAVLRDENAAKTLRENYCGATKILSGDEGLMAAATYEGADTVLGALVGYAGLKPTLAAINSGKNIALANKETLVAAGEIVMAAIKEKGVSLTPVDSEHSAIFQSLQGGRHSELKRILLTASGGPFRGKKREELEHVTIEQCLKHPNWSMGKKVTVDSATLANKGLEVIEAHWLFDTPYEKIQPVIHPQSIVHSLVEFQDGSVIGQLGLPDMRLPIQYALSYPERWDSSFGTLDLVKAGALTFFEPDTEAFPALAMALECGRAGGLYPCVFNAANEVAVNAFLEGRLKFLGIPALIEKTLAKFTNVTHPMLEDIVAADTQARVIAAENL